MTQTQSIAAQPIYDTHEIARTVGYIRSIAGQGDYEQARVLERTLWNRALEAVAGGTAQAAYIAGAVLETAEIDFPRY
jgi:hypothetical protein